MGIRYAQSLSLVVITSCMLLAAPSWGNPGARWPPQTGFSPRPWTPRQVREPRRIIVGGGSSKWTFGVNYTDWAIKNGPFYINDTLVFQYDPPTAQSHPHNVILFWDWWSFMSCNVSNAFVVGSETQGAGAGFELKLTWPWYLIGCGERAGYHCTAGMMKLPVWPFPNWK
ncbi:uncharacterized protein LOC131160796 [Malania oleifera]|uniref:uncharacterized protein LOC131160796 n=1 Tax=Malania oleifera TaxID=397392 RepID=UPI0025AE9CB2|nr:uncharacterized protein LOC131160796 [Malania oleifera]